MTESLRPALDHLRPARRGCDLALRPTSPRIQSLGAAVPHDIPEFCAGKSAIAETRPVFRAAVGGPQAHQSAMATGVPAVAWTRLSSEDTAEESGEANRERPTRHGKHISSPLPLSPEIKLPRRRGRDNAVFVGAPVSKGFSLRGGLMRIARVLSCCLPLAFAAPVVRADDGDDKDVRKEIYEKVETKN